MALHSLYCADVPLRNCSLTHYLLTPYCTKHSHYLLILLFIHKQT